MHSLASPTVKAPPRIIEFVRQLRHGLLGILLIMAQDAQTTLFSSIFGTFVDFLQMMYFIFPWGGTFPWHVSVEWLSYASYIFRFGRQTVEATSVMIAGMLGMSLILLLAVLAAIVGVAYVKENYQFFWVLKLLRQVAGRLTGSFFIPIIAVSCQLLFCRDASLPCWSDWHLPVAIMILIFVTAFIYFSWVVKASFFDDKPPTALSASYLARPHTLESLLHLVIKTILTAMYVLFGHVKELHWLLGALTCGSFCAEAFVHVMFPPYFRPSFNVFTAALASCRAWASICLIITLLTDDATNSGASFLFFGGVGPIMVLSYYALATRLRQVNSWTLNSVMYRDDGLRSVFDVELMVRCRMQSVVGLGRRSIRRGKGGASATTGVGSSTSYQVDEETTGLVPVESESGDAGRTGAGHGVAHTSAQERHLEHVTMECQEIFRQASIVFSPHPWLEVFRAQHAVLYTANLHIALRYLRKAEQMQPNIDVEFFVGKLRRRIRDKFSGNSHGQDVIDYLRVQQLGRDAIKYDEIATQAQIDLWTELMNPNPDGFSLRQAAKKLIRYTELASHEYREFCAAERDSQGLRQFASFLLEVANDPHAAQLLLNRAEALDVPMAASNVGAGGDGGSFRNGNDVADLQNPHNGVIIIDLCDEALGEIVQVNDTVCQMFGWSSDQFLGRNVNMIIPVPYKQHHDHFLSSYLERGYGSVMNTVRTVVAEKRGGDIFSVNMHIRQFTSASGTLQCAAVLSKVQHQTMLAIVDDADMVVAMSVGWDFLIKTHEDNDGYANGGGLNWVGDRTSTINTAVSLPGVQSQQRERRPIIDWLPSYHDKILPALTKHESAPLVLTCPKTHTTTHLEVSGQLVQLPGGARPFVVLSVIKHTRGNGIGPDSKRIAEERAADETVGLLDSPQSGVSGDGDETTRIRLIAPGSSSSSPSAVSAAPPVSLSAMKSFVEPSVSSTKLSHPLFAPRPASQEPSRRRHSIAAPSSGRASGRTSRNSSMSLFAPGVSSAQTPSPATLGRRLSSTIQPVSLPSSCPVGGDLLSSPIGGGGLNVPHNIVSEQHEEEAVAAAAGAAASKAKKKLDVSSTDGSDKHKKRVGNAGADQSDKADIDVVDDEATAQPPAMEDMHIGLGFHPTSLRPIEQDQRLTSLYVDNRDVDDDELRGTGDGSHEASDDGFSSVSSTFREQSSIDNDIDGGGQVSRRRVTFNTPDEQQSRAPSSLYAGSVAGSSIAGPQKMIKKLQSIVAHLNSLTDSNLLYFRRVFVLSITGLLVAVIMLYIDLRASLLDFGDQADVVQETHKLTYLAVHIGMLTHALVMTQARVADAGHVGQLVDELRHSAVELRRIKKEVDVGGVAATNAVLFTRQSLPVYRLVGEDVERQTMNLHELVNELSSRAQVVATKASLDLSTASVLNADTFFVLANADNSVVRALNVSASTFTTDTAKILRDIDQTQVQLIYSISAALACVLVFILRPSVLAIESNYDSVVRIFLEIPRNTVKELLANSIARLHFVRGDEPDEDFAMDLPVAGHQDGGGSSSGNAHGSSGGSGSNSPRRGSRVQPDENTNIDWSQVVRTSKMVLKLKVALSFLAAILYFIAVQQIGPETHHLKLTSLSRQVTWSQYRLFTITNVAYRVQALAGQQIDQLNWRTSFPLRNLNALIERDIALGVMGVTSTNSYVSRDIAVLGTYDAAFASIRHVVHVQASLEYGNEILNLVPAVGSDNGAHSRMSYGSMCGIVPFPTNITRCRAFDGSILQQGLHATVSQFAATTQALGLNMQQQVTDSSGGARVARQLLTLPRYALMHEYVDEWLSRAVEYSTSTFDALMVDDRNSYAKSISILLGVALVAIVALFVFLYLPLSAHLEEQIQTTHMMLLVIPASVLPQVPSIRRLVSTFSKASDGELFVQGRAV